MSHIQVSAVTSQGSLIKIDHQRPHQFIHFIHHISTFIILRISYSLYFSRSRPCFLVLNTPPTPPPYILHQDLLTDNPLNGEELTPQSRSKSPFLISTQHQGVNKSVSVIVIIIIMISLKQFYQLDCLKMTILLHVFVFIFCGLLLSSLVTSIFVIWASLYFSLKFLHHLVQSTFPSYTTVFSA